MDLFNLPASIDHPARSILRVFEFSTDAVALITFLGDSVDGAVKVIQATIHDARRRCFISQGAIGAHQREDAALPALFDDLCRPPPVRQWLALAKDPALKKIVTRFIKQAVKKFQR
jgi:hypothetical protein